MLTTLKRRRWLGLTAVVVGVLVSAALGAVAYASIPDAGGVIQGCYKTASGDLRVIDDSNASCKAGETALDWNQQGIQGPQGPQGQQGPPGQDSVSGHVYVSNPNSHVIDTPSPAEQEIVGLSGLPPGNYLIWSPIEIYGDDAGFDGECAWRVNDQTPYFDPKYGVFPVYDAKDDQHGQFPMFGEIALTQSSNSVKVECSSYSDNHPEAGGQMIALRVGDVN